VTFKTILFTLLGAGVLAAGVAVTYFAGQSEGSAGSNPPSASFVEVVQPNLIDRSPALTTTGFIAASDRLAIAPEVAGRVVEVSADFEIGETLAAGQTIVSLDATTFEAEVMRAESALAGAQAAEDQSRNALARQTELSESDFASEATIDDLSANVALAEADVTSARAALQTARKRLDETTLTVPFDAIVVSEDVSLGQLLQPAQTVGEVVRADRAELRTSLTESDYRMVSANGTLIGRTFSVIPSPGRTLTARVTAVSPEIGGNARMIEIIALIENPFRAEPPLLLNSFVDVRIDMPDIDRPVFEVPLQALQVGQRIWKLSEDDTLLPVSFRIDRRTESALFIVSDDLSPDDRVVMTALQTQVEGRQVRVANTGDGA